MDYKEKTQELRIVLDELYSYSFRGQMILKDRADFERAFWGISNCGFKAINMDGFLKKIQ